MADAEVLSVIKFDLTMSSPVNVIIDTVRDWAIARDDVRPMALAGSWARGNARAESHIDVLLLTDRMEEYQASKKWLDEIDFAHAGYRIEFSEGAAYGSAWSQHIHLLPRAEVELTFANCNWASSAPLDAGTRRIVSDGFRILFDKDGQLAKLILAVTSA